MRSTIQGCTKDCSQCDEDIDVMLRNCTIGGAAQQRGRTFCVKSGPGGGSEPAPPPPTPPLLPPPSKAKVRVPACSADGTTIATIDKLFMVDGSGEAAERTTLSLCWTKKHLHIRAKAYDRQVISNKANCGDSTWKGDSIEAFLAPLRKGSAQGSTPTAWMEVDVAAAGGMYFAAITGNGKDGYGGGHPAGPKHGPGPCHWPGLQYNVTHTKGGRPSQYGYKTEGSWGYTMDVPWAAFAQHKLFRSTFSSWGGKLPRVWRANFYRTNFFAYGQHDPGDYYACKCVRGGLS
jgi:hypothetical protein